MLSPAYRDKIQIGRLGMSLFYKKNSSRQTIFLKLELCLMQVLRSAIDSAIALPTSQWPHWRVGRKPSPPLK